MEFWCVKILFRILETKAQSKIPDMTLFNSREKAEKYYAELMSKEIQFVSRQISLLRVKMSIEEDVTPKPKG
jgi:hypothetical protein